MSAPPKPWERLGDVNHRQPIYQPDLTPSFMPSSPHMMPGPGGGSSMAGTAMRPPLPPRPTTIAPYSTYPRPTYGGYGTMGTGMYGGAYRGFGQYGMSGLPDINDENGFIQLAEDSSRQAFQSIESIVHAFGSVSMMLESTYHAVYSSFRAVLGVADHFNRMKSHFAQIFSALAVVRTLRWLYNKLLFLIGLRSQDPSLEAVWRNANASLPNASQITEGDIKASKSSWPIVLFLGVVFGGPYLIWRLLSSLVPSKVKSHGWVTGQEEHYAAIGQYPFQARTKNELSFGAGQSLLLAPKDHQPSYQGWLLASNGNNVGLVPANYIKILGLRSPQPQQNSSHQKQGSQLVASTVPNIPSHLGPRAAIPHSGTTGRHYGNYSVTPDIQQRLPPPTQPGMVPRIPINTQQGQRLPLATQHGQGTPLTAHQGQRPQPIMQQREGFPLSTQWRQGAPLNTQQECGPSLSSKQGQGAPISAQHEQPLSAQQGQAIPLNALQGQGASPNTHQGQVTPIITQQGQGTPVITQQGQGTPVITQQGQGTPVITQQGQGTPVMTQQGQGTPVMTQQGQGTPVMTQQGQGTPVMTQQGQGTPVMTQQGQGTPVITQQGQGTPVTQQEQGTPVVTEQGQGTPVITQQRQETLVTTQEGQGTPVVTEQGRGTPFITQEGQGTPVITPQTPITLGYTSNSSPRPPPFTQQNKPKGIPLPPQNTPPSEDLEADSAHKTSQSRDE